MVRKKIDNRIRVLIENGVALGHRTMFVVVGDKGKDQVSILLRLYICYLLCRPVIVSGLFMVTNSQSSQNQGLF